MLYEAAYPGLWLVARAKHLRARLTVAMGRGSPLSLQADPSPETHLRVASWKIRKFEIDALARLAPAWGAAKALERFEITRRPKLRKRVVDYMAGMELIREPYQGRRVDIRLAGPEDGPRVLMLHGWNATGAGLAPLIDRLVADGYRVFAPDMPGHGSSEGGRYAFQQLGKAMAAVCNRHGPFEAVLGHSAGGLIAAIALKDGLRANRLVTLSAPGSLDGLLETYLLTNQLPATLMPAMRQRYLRQFGCLPAEIGPPLFARLKCPVLAVQDEHDWMISKTNARDIAGAAHRGEAFFTSNYSHLSILRAPEFHDRLLAFLKTAPTAQEAGDA